MEEVNEVEDLLIALRKNWKFPAVVHFCRVFEGVLGLNQFSSDQLERALLSPGEHPVFFSELVSRLLYPGRKLSQNPEAWPAWEQSLQKKVKTHWSLVLNQDPIVGRHFVDLSASDKLDVLYLLTELALHNSALLRDTIRNTVEDPYLTADSVRCLPIGENEEGEKFFLFSLRYEDCRLYKQSPAQEMDMDQVMQEQQDDEQEVDRDEVDDEQERTRKVDGEAPEWCTVTTNLRELQDFVVQVRRSKNPAEKKLYKYLAGILPEFERTERHRKKVEEKAIAREQTPLLKRSSRLQEQAKRKEEQERGISTEEKDVSNGEVKDEVMAEDDQSMDLGISREERMRLRNRRRELAETGLRRVLTGRKRMLEYDGLTPLGPSVKCVSRKRVQNVRPPRQVNKLVSIIWEKFRRPMHHRKQFELHLEAVKKRRINYLQHRHELNQRPKQPIYVSKQHLEEGALGGLRFGNDPSLGDGQRSYTPPRNVLLNYFQRQRPPLQNYAIPAPLRMPAPLQNNPEGGSNQTFRPILQQHLNNLQSQIREPILRPQIARQPNFITENIKRQFMHKQRSQQSELEQKNPFNNFHRQGCTFTNQRGVDGSVRNLPSALYCNQLGGQSMPSGHSVGPYTARAGDMLPTTLQHQQNINRAMEHRMAAVSAVNPVFRNLRPALVANQLSPSLVQIPASLNRVINSSWNSKCPTILGGFQESPRLTYAQPLYPCPDRELRTSVPLMFDEGSSWQHNPPPFHNKHLPSDASSSNNSKNRIKNVYLEREGDINRRSNNTQ